ncbi:MAG TPA: histone deacetylase family protein, partial [Deltaproteobacteria bacterium]|nr:histone deacetylase family protein [Deltaproteobacteria bacterium]
MKVVFHEDFYSVYTMDPAAEEGRIEAVVEVVGPHVMFVPAQNASEVDIEAVHTEAQIDYVKGQGLHEIATLAAGGAILGGAAG